MSPRRGRWCAIGLCLAALSSSAGAQPDWFPSSGSTGAPPAVPAHPLEPGDPCADPLLGPVAPPMWPTGIDRARSACLASAVDLTATTGAALEGGGVHGAFDGGLLIGLRWRFLAGVEADLALRAPGYQWAHPAAGASDTTLGVGPASLGLSADLGRGHRAFGRPLRLAWGVRFDVPWTDSLADAAVLAAAPVVRASLGLSPDLAAHARLLALLLIERPTGDIQTHRAVALSADLAWAAWHPVVLAVGAEGQGGLYGAGLDHLLVRGGGRVGLGLRMRIELGGAVRLAGSEPRDLALSLGLTGDL